VAGLGLVEVVRELRDDGALPPPDLPDRSGTGVTRRIPADRGTMTRMSAQRRRADRSMLDLLGPRGSQALGGRT
jgi:hypothetical protein